MNISLGHVCACSQPIIYFEADRETGQPIPVPGLMWLLNPVDGKADILVLDPSSMDTIVRKKIPECDWRSPQAGHWSWPAQTDREMVFKPLNRTRPRPVPIAGSASPEEVSLDVGPADPGD